MDDSTPTRTRIHHVALTVTDLDASVDWYQQVFSVSLPDGRPT